MKHLVLNQELKDDIFPDENVVIFSCQFDDGKLSKNSEPLRLGADGMEVWFFPCFSCLQQIQDYILAPMVLSALKENKIERLSKSLEDLQDAPA